MFKIKDKITLGLAAGVMGNLVKAAVARVSSRPAPRGTLAGGVLDFGLGALGGIGAVQLLSNTGKNHLVTKGLISGVTMGSTGSLIKGAVFANQAKSGKPTVFSAMVGGAAYGVAATYAAAKFGHPSLFGREEQKDYSKSAEYEADQRREQPEEGKRGKTKIISLAKLRKSRTIKYL